jgi:polysaccharide biosynthesis/export protein
MVGSASGSGVASVVLWAFLAGCLASCAQPAQNQAAETIRKQEYELDAPQTCGLSQLMELWQQRRRHDPGDFPIGPGDVITVSVPELEELQKREVRVASDGTIGLSLIGTMEVAGMDEDQLRGALVKRLATFMKYPRVDLFVQRYQTRQVAVTGAVQKPGRYTLANMDQSILDMIGRAGGMTTDSAQKVIFVPAESQPHLANVADSKGTISARSTTALGEGAYRPAALEENAQPPLGESNADRALKGRNWIGINLADPQAHACLGIPTRPGDVIIVPIAGEVMVQGWVNKPGAFKITPGMTILGAVSAAGGATYSSFAKLIRNDSAGHVETQFDLSDLANGTETDVPVQSGDVVIVEPSLAGALPYALLQILGRVGAGLYLPIP